MLIVVTRGVLQRFETIATSHCQRYLLKSFQNQAIEYDETGSSVSSAYDDFYPVIISVLEEILASPDNLVKDEDRLVDLIRVIQGQIEEDSTNLKSRILSLLKFSGTRRRRYEAPLEALENIMALATIPRKRVIETRQPLRNAKASFRTVQPT